MSDAKHQRRFWQFHLGTAILLVLSIGLVVWLNARKRFTEISPIPIDGDFADGVVEQGWPFAFYRKNETLIRGETLEHFKEVRPDDSVDEMLIVSGKGIAVPAEWLAQVADYKPIISKSNGLLDCVVGVLFLFGIVAISEVFIWRRENLSENASRPWYRLHALTLLVTALAFAGLLALNLTGRPLDFRAPKAVIDSGYQREVYGWPYRAYITDWTFDCMDRSWIKFDDYNDMKAMVIDVVLLISLPAVIALVVEWLVRRPKLKAMGLGLRWHLDTQLMLIMLLGTILYVWHTRCPWALKSSEVVNGPMNDPFDTKVEVRSDGVAFSEDGSRGVSIDFKDVNVWSAAANLKTRRHELETKDLLCQLTPTFIPFRAEFVDNDALVVVDESPEREGPIQVLKYRRRFPDLTALGHLQRPEVWALISIAAIFLWRLSRNMRRRETDKT